MRRRLAMLVVAALLVVPAPTVAQTATEEDQAQMLVFAGIAADGSKAIQEGALAFAEAYGVAERLALRQELASQRERLLTVDPGICWIRTYVTYWEGITLLDTALALFDVDITAANTVLRMATEKAGEFNADELYACIGMQAP